MSQRTRSRARRARSLDARAPRGAEPYLFAYDVADDRLRRRAAGILYQWRVAGQYSVHETWVTRTQALDLAVAVRELLDPRTDRLILARLSRHARPPGLGGAARKSPVVGPTLHAGSAPRHRGAERWHLMAYDVRDSERLRRVHKVAAAATVFVQKSVYLYHGSSAKLAELMDAVREHMESVDDLRAYALRSVADLWAVCGPTPPVHEGTTGGRMTRAGPRHARSARPVP